MKVTFQILFSFLFLSFTSRPINCDKLSNGKYKVLFSDYFKQYENYEIKITNNTYVKYLNNGDSTLGTVKWNNDCTLILSPTIKAYSDSLTVFEKLHQTSFGNHLIEIKIVKGDTIYFRTTYTSALQITINEGKFIREKS